MPGYRSLARPAAGGVAQRNAGRPQRRVRTRQHLRAAAADAQIRFPASAPDGSCGAQRLSLRIPIADDNADAGGSLAEALRTCGAEVRLVDSGLAAIDNHADFAPDVAILVIGVPRVTGYDVARMLRSRGASEPLIALTGLGRAADRERAFSSGFDRNQVKPVAIPVLLESLQSIEAGQATRGESADAQAHGGAEAAAG